MDGEFDNVFADNDQIAKLISDRRLRAVKFTGSTLGGKAVASECAKSMTKGCFELGGSDPFVVLDSADLEKAV